MNKVVLSLLDYRPDAAYIRKSGLPWLKLDLVVPVGDILKEFSKVEDQLVLHRKEDKTWGMSHKHWYSLTLYGKSALDTESSEPPLKWTSVSDMCPKTTKWIKDNFNITDKTKRIRFMYISSGGYILPHEDTEDSILGPVNIAVTNPDKCIFRFLNKGTVPFKAGSAFMLDVSNKHLVINNSNEFRLHIIVHTQLNNELIERSYEKSYYNL